MRRLIAGLVIAAGLISASSIQAREIEDGKLLVYPEKNNHYRAGDFTGDKVGFYGYAGDRLETKHITGLLLKKGENATPEQKHIIYVTAKQMQIGAFIELDGKEQPIVEAPPPAPPVPAAPVAPAVPADPPAAAAPAAAAPAAAPEAPAQQHQR